MKIWESISLNKRACAFNLSYYDVEESNDTRVGTSDGKGIQGVALAMKGEQEYPAA